MRFAIALMVLCGTAHAELTKQVVRKAIKQHIREIVDCMEQHHPDTSRPVIIDFTIAASGKVTQSVGRNNPPVDDCIAHVIKAIRFPASNSATQVKYPFWIDSAGS